MKKILILLLVCFFVSVKSQNVYDLKHSIKYVIKDSCAYKYVIAKDSVKHVFLFRLTKKNKLIVGDSSCLAEIQGSGRIYDYEDKYFIGSIVDKKITNGDEKLLGYIYPDFGYAVNDSKVKLAYVDSDVNCKIAALLIYFYKDLGD